MSNQNQSSALVRSRQAAMASEVPAPTGPSGVQLAESIQIANVLAKTTGGAIPKAYQGDPGGILAMVIWGQRNGIDAITAMWGVWRIPNKDGDMVPFVSAALRNDLANDKGFEFEVCEHTRERCVIQVIDHRSGQPVPKGQPVVVTIDEIEDDKFGIDRATGEPVMKVNRKGERYPSKPTAWDTRPDRMLHRRAQRDADAYHVQTGLVSTFDLADSDEIELLDSDVLDVIDSGDPVAAVVTEAGLADPETDLAAPSDAEVTLAPATDVAALLATVKGLPDGQQATFKAKAAQVAQGGIDSWSFADTHVWTEAELADAAAWVAANCHDPAGGGDDTGDSEDQGEDEPEPRLDPSRSARVKEALAGAKVAHRVMLDAMNDAHGTRYRSLRALDGHEDLTEWALVWVDEYVKQRDSETSDG